jgi:hypothetical protein
MSHWQACINAKFQKKLTAFLFLLWQQASQHRCGPQRQN